MAKTIFEEMGGTYVRQDLSQNGKILRQVFFTQKGGNRSKYL